MKFFNKLWIVSGFMVLGLVSGCHPKTPWTRLADMEMFYFSGGTIFTQPQRATTKQLHFDAGELLGREVIVEGRVTAVGKYFTHLVMEDDVGKMLVVMTQIDKAQEIFEKRKPVKVQILGSVERGKKGLPFVFARSINIVKSLK